MVLENNSYFQIVMNVFKCNEINILKTRFYQYNFQELIDIIIIVLRNESVEAMKLTY